MTRNSGQAITRKVLKEELQIVRKEFKGEFEVVRKEFKDELKTVRKDFKQQLLELGKQLSDAILRGVEEMFRTQDKIYDIRFRKLEKSGTFQQNRNLIPLKHRVDRHITSPH